MPRGSLLREILLVATAGLLAAALFALLRWDALASLRDPSDSGATACLGQGPTLDEIVADEASALCAAHDVRFIDARPAEAFQKGHIVGAIHVPEDRARALPPDLVAELKAARLVVVYDDAPGCSQSHAVLAALRTTGTRNLRVLADGFAGWLNRGYPAEAGACTCCGRHS